MQIGMIGLGRMGGSMVRRLQQDGHQCVVFHRSQEKIQPFLDLGAQGATDLKSFLDLLQPPRSVWLMVPAGAVDGLMGELTELLDRDDTLIDGGNSYYKDDIQRYKRLRQQGIHYLDVGTSGGVWGEERGYCMMIGGEQAIYQRHESLFHSLAPGMGDIERTRGREGDPIPAEMGYLHCGPAGSGHFVKMVHNGIEYGLMAAYAEGLNLLRHANIGNQDAEHSAETTPLREPETLQYDINIAEVSEVWRRGSVVSSWLLDLTANALHGNLDLEEFSGRVSDSGEGRWTSIAAIESGTPAHVLTSALFNRFSSRGESDYADKILSAMRLEFGGHKEQKS